MGNVQSDMELADEAMRSYREGELLVVPRTTESATFCARLLTCYYLYF